MIRKITPQLRERIHTARDVEMRRASGAFSTAYDVCVIGSGPGGSVAAATLAEAGLKVALVERGPFFPAEESSFRVLDQSNRMGHLELTSGYRTILYQGNGLGGGSLLYGAVAMQPPQYVFDEWSERSGVALDLRALGPHYDHVARILSVTRQDRTQENASNAVVREMASALGRPEGLEVVSRYTRGCAGVGLCNFGCGLDLKGNMINSFLPLGLETGRLTILTECEAVAFNGERKNGEFRATGLGVVVRDFASGKVIAREVIRARAYVVSAAAFFSSGLLKRIGELGGRERIGEKIHLQPHAQIFALFDRAMTHPGRIENGQHVPYNGVPAIYNFTGMLEDYRFFWLASILFPANFATFISSLAPEEHYQLMRQFHQVMSITITLRDDPQKARVGIKDSKPHLDFRESALDINNLRECFLQAARGFLAVGARRVFLPLLRPPRIERESDLVRIERLKFGYQDLLLYSDHTSGGNPIGRDASRGVCDEWGRVFGAGNLYVADSSLFPSASGINPSWTIMALSHRLAKNLSSNMV